MKFQCTIEISQNGKSMHVGSKYKIKFGNAIQKDSRIAVDEIVRKIQETTNSVSFNGKMLII